MSVSPLRGLGLFAPMFLFAQAAQADLSAQDVWSDWKEYLTSAGYNVSASEAQSGVTLEVSDILLEMGMEDAVITVSMGAIEFVENGDGTVNVQMPAEMPFGYRFVSADEEVEDVSGNLIYTHDGSPMVVSGDASGMTYLYETETASLILGELTFDGALMPDDIFALSVDLTDIASETVMTIADIRNYSQSLTAASVTYDVSFNDPESGEGATMKGALQGLDFVGDMILPDVADPTDIAAMIKAGMTYVGNFSFTGAATDLQGNEGGNNFAMQTASQEGEFNVAFGAEGMAYDFVQNDTTLNISGSDIPFPLSLEMAQLGMNFAMPLTKSDNEQDFALGVALRDFAVPEMLWGLVDPMGELPHDPATLVLDLSGTGKLFMDLTDDAQIAAVEAGEDVPGELHSLDVNELLLSVAGAELTGSGAFTFDNSDLDSFDGMPAPTGEANLKLVGANTLLDKLVAMGLLSDEDAMGPRMMMGMFSVPGEGEDTLTSKIEVTEDGKVLANGQRLK